MLVNQMCIFTDMIYSTINVNIYKIDINYLFAITNFDLILQTAWYIQELLIWINQHFKILKNETIGNIPISTCRRSKMLF